MNKQERGNMRKIFSFVQNLKVVKIDRESLEKIDQLAKLWDTSHNDVINHAIVSYMGLAGVRRLLDEQKQKK
jgi:hypothetical protein